MEKTARIYVAGHTGMVGSAIVRFLKQYGYRNIIKKTHRELDLTNQKKTEGFFKKEKPEYVFLAAAKVGGILANNNFKGEFIYENLMIQNNIIHFSFETGVKKLLFLGSACIYPRLAKQPIVEQELLTSSLESTNDSYAIAKIAGIKLCQSYYKQYGKNFISVMPNNLYGQNDNFDPETSHVIPGLVQKIHKAKICGKKDVEIWGSGNPLREFLHVDDLATAVIFVMNNLDAKELYAMGISHINVGSGDELSIKNLAVLIKEIIGFDGLLIFNKNKPDGTPRKLLNTSILNGMGWKSKIPLNKGLKDLYEWYKRNN